MSANRRKGIIPLKQQQQMPNTAPQQIIAKDLTPLQFKRLIDSLADFNIFTSLQPNLQIIEDSYIVTTQDRRLTNALHYMIDTFFNDKKPGKNLHIVIDDLHFNQHEPTPASADELNGVDEPESFCTNLAEFFELFSRFVCTLLAYTHDYKNQAHFYVEKHEINYAIMTKWKLVLACMADVYSAIQTKSCKKINLSPLSTFWDDIIKNNISAVHALNSKMMHYERMINESRYKLSERDRKITEILEQYADVNYRMPVYQGEFDQAREELNKLNTGAESLEEFDNAAVPKAITHVNTTRSLAPMTPLQRQVAKTNYSAYTGGHNSLF